jgi:hypothetical protein
VREGEKISERGREINIIFGLKYRPLLKGVKENARKRKDKGK